MSELSDYEKSQLDDTCHNCGYKIENHSKENIKYCLWNLARLYNGWSKKCEGLQSYIKKWNNDVSFFHVEQTTKEKEGQP